MNTAHEEKLQQARETPRGIEDAHKALRFDHAEWRTLWDGYNTLT
jgi:hypothetical protein